MPEEIECPKHQAWLFLHCAKEGACEICLRLDGWFYFQGNHDDPYPISQHDKCQCYWNDFLIEGLYRFQREEMLNAHADINQLYYNALVEIVAWDDKIAEAVSELGGLKEDKTSVDRDAETSTQNANDLVAAAQEIIDSHDELTEELQSYVDELLLQADDLIRHAEECIERSGELQQEINQKEGEIQSKNDERDAEIYKRDEALAKLKELEPCLSLRCIEDEVEAMAGSRLIMNF